MSILFPKVNKPREWDYRPIYYDPEKEERKERLRRLQAEREQKEGKEVEGGYKTTLHRGSFREAAERYKTDRTRTKRNSNLRFWIVLLILLLVVFYYFL